MGKTGGRPRLFIISCTYFTRLIKHGPLGDKKAILITEAHASEHFVECTLEYLNDYFSKRKPLMGKYRNKLRQNLS